MLNNSWYPNKDSTKISPAGSCLGKMLNGLNREGSNHTIFLVLQISENQIIPLEKVHYYSR